MLKIDQEFKGLIPPLTEEEFKQLEQNCIKDGILESIKTWGGVIVDGHNRHEIANKNGLDFAVTELNFENRTDAIEWIILHQLGRRNLTEEQKAYLRGKRYENEKLKHGGDRKKDSNPQNEDLKTSEKLATEYNVSKATIERDADFAEGVDLIGEFEPETKTEILAGKSDFTKQEIQQVAKAYKAAEKEARAEHSATEKSRGGVVFFGNEIAMEEEEYIEAEIQIRAKDMAEQKIREIQEEKKLYKAQGTGENEWYTPIEIIEMARVVMGGIDLDPASCEEANKVVSATSFFTAKTDGLKHDWHGRVWLNPPYSRDLMPAFVQKLLSEVNAGRVSQAIMLSHNNTDTAWFHSVCSKISCVCFPKKRIKFYRGKNVAAPVNGQAFFYIGKNSSQFYGEFSKMGIVLRPYE